MKLTKKLWICLGILALVSPVGLYFADKAKAGAAWGEWSAAEIKNLVGYVPLGLKKLASLWNPPIPDYTFKGTEQVSPGHRSLAYIVSAIVGIGLCAGVMVIIGRFLTRKKRR